MAGASPPGWYRRLSEECPPLRHTPVRWDCAEARLGFQRFMVVADWLRLAPMPWQRLVLALLADPEVFELVVVVGRQQGKTRLLAVPMTDVLVRRPGCSVIYAAQSGIDAQKKIKDEFQPMMLAAGLGPQLGFKFNQGTHDFGIHGANGAHLRTMSSKQDALRGTTRVALGVIDEARAAKDHQLNLQLTPTMTALDDAKKVVCSTAGHAGSMYLRQRLDDARARLEAGERDVALVEWGVEDDDDEIDADDPRVWRRALPGLGYVCGPPAIARAKATMEPHDFRMEYLGKWLETAVDEAIPWAVWNRCRGKKTRPAGELVLAVDAPPSGGRAAMVACDARGRIELVDVHEVGGPSGIVTWVKELVARHGDVSRVVMQPTAVLERCDEALRREGVRVVSFDFKRVGAACERFWEAVHSELPGLEIRADALLDAANRGAFRYAVGQRGWVFRPQTVHDFTAPLTAAAMAFHEAMSRGERPAAPIMELLDAAERGELADPWDAAVA